MVSTGGKELLRNIIKHTEAHNKITEEAEMWSKWEKNKSADKRAKKDRQQDGYTFTYKDSGSSSTFWMRKLATAEDADPNRWGHSGFKELYPDKFVSEDEELTSKKAKKKKKKKHKRRKYESDNNSDSLQPSIKKHKIGEDSPLSNGKKKSKIRKESPKFDKNAKNCESKNMKKKSSKSSDHKKRKRKKQSLRERM